MKRSAPTTLLCLLVSCSAPDTSTPAPHPAGENAPLTVLDPAPEATDGATADAVPTDPVDPEDRPPTPEDLAASADDNAPATPADLLAAAEGEEAPPEDVPPAPLASPEDAPEVPADPTADWTDGPAQVPYTAWTTRAGVALTGLGGRDLATLEQAGLRVEVVAEQGGRVNVQCRACPGTWRDAGGWLPRAAVHPAARTVPADSPLSAALTTRARWAAGLDLPEESAQIALCRLLDQGYTLSADGQTARWTTEDGGAAIATRSRDGWAMAPDLDIPDGNPPWPCTVTAPAP